MEPKRFVRIDPFSGFHRYYICVGLRRYYAYMDHSDHPLDNLFIQEKIPVRFLREYAKPKSCWRIVVVRVAKRDACRFEQAFDQAEKFLLLKGYRGWTEACRNLDQFS